MGDWLGLIFVLGLGLFVVVMFFITAGGIDDEGQYRYRMIADKALAGEGLSEVEMKFQVQNEKKYQKSLQEISDRYDRAMIKRKIKLQTSEERAKEIKTHSKCWHCGEPFGGTNILKIVKFPDIWKCTNCGAITKSE